MNEILADQLLEAYAHGIFPMSDTRSADTFHWVQPKRRGVLFLDSFHVPTSLKKILKKQNLQIRIDHAFEQVITGCAERTKDRPETWINDQIINVYSELFVKGLVHTVETWDSSELVGGVYGLSIGKVFFGESMFSKEPNASKIALCYLVSILKMGGFNLLDTQFKTNHLEQFGVVEISHSMYMKELNKHLWEQATFGPVPSHSELDLTLGLQLSNQIS
jgi:leucyl/phenylalanyl-tRNA--protein transferase